MEAKKVTNNNSYNSQMLYFTSPSITNDNKHLFFVSDKTGNPNIVCKDIETGEERQLTNNTDGTLKSYVYFNGNEGKGLGKASICLDPENQIAYFIHGANICCVDVFGKQKILNRVPEGQVTAFTHISRDGKKLCVPTTDARALEAEKLVNDSPNYNIGKNEKNEVISNKPDYDIDERVQRENLNSYLRVYDTETGKEVLCEKVNKAWITHVQFCPNNSNIILYNHEWPSDCGIRRMWLWDGNTHIRLRTEGENRRAEDWTCHEMWQADGQYIIYHGKYKDGTAYIGRVEMSGNDNVEIQLPENYTKYGHFTAGNLHNNWLVSDGYFHSDGGAENGHWGGEWISLQKVDWENRRIEWVPLCKHHSIWDCQDSHPHPILNKDDTEVYFTSNKEGTRAVYFIKIT